MNKSLVERFISKYNLAGAADRVKWEAGTTGIVTKFVSEDGHVVGNVSAKTLQLEQGTYCIYETNLLRSLLSVLDETIDVTVQNRDNKPVALNLKDGSTKVTFVLSIPENIPKVPIPKQLPEFENVLTIDSAFMERFIRAKGALPDVESFTVISDGKSSDVILGYSADNNTNRVTIKTASSRCEKADPIDFHARYMREILVANKEAKSGKLEVSSEGLSRVTFEMDDFDVTYYLPQIQRED